jgi:hypothetical protein
MVEESKQGSLGRQLGHKAENRNKGGKGDWLWLFFVFIAVGTSCSQSSMASSGGGPRGLGSIDAIECQQTIRLGLCAYLSGGPRQADGFWL